jgi:hypothetical protein
VTEPDRAELAAQVADFERKAEHKGRRDKIIGRAAAVLAVLCLLAAGWTWYEFDKDADANARGDAARDLRVTKLEGDAATTKAEYRKLYAQFERCKDEKPDTAGCREPIAPAPSELPKTTVSTGPTNTTIVRREVLPLSVIRAAVLEVVNMALRATCGDDGCRDGKAGDIGQTGQPGADGIPGPPGPEGPAGKDGADGRGIVSGPTCNDDGTWTTTYNKPPLTETQPGPCRVFPGPPTEESKP